jgi:hypothetical protein
MYYAAEMHSVVLRPRYSGCPTETYNYLAVNTKIGGYVALVLSDNLSSMKYRFL